MTENVRVLHIGNEAPRAMSISILAALAMSSVLGECPMCDLLGPPRPLVIKERGPKPVGKGGTNRQKRARQGKNW